MRCHGDFVVGRTDLCCGERCGEGERPDDFHGWEEAKLRSSCQAAAFENLSPCSAAVDNHGSCEDPGTWRDAGKHHDVVPPTFF